MRRSRWAVCVVCLCAGVPAPALAEYKEDWNSAVLRNNNWRYFVEGAPDNGEVQMPWQATGGVGDTGHVQCPLAELTQWSAVPASTNYWPCWTKQDYHSIDLGADEVIRIAIKDVTPPIGTVPGGVDLKGGTIHFWIGEWLPAPQPGDPNLMSFFIFDTELSWGDDWTQNQIVINEKDWTTLVDNQGKSAAQLFDNPQQWGFGILGGTGDPTGVLGFDAFESAVPEPTAMTLLVLGSAVLIRRRRWR